MKDTHGTGRFRWRILPRSSIGSRFIGLVLLVVLLAGGVGSYVHIAISRDSLRQEVHNKQLAQAELVADFVSHYMQAVQANIRLFAERPDVRQALLNDAAGQLQPTLSRFVAIQTALEASGLYDTNGIQLANSYADTAFVGQSFADREWFQQVMATGNQYLSAPLLSKSTGNSMVPFAVPVLDEQGRVIGVLGGGISIGHLSDHIVHAGYDSNTIRGVIDLRDGGTVVVHIDPKRVGTRVSGDNEAVNRLVAGESGIMELTDKSGTHVLVAFTQIPDLPWGIILHTPSATALAVVNTLTRNTLLSTGLVVLFAGALGVIMTLGVTRPLRRLVEATDNIGLGNLEYKVDTTASDEIGDLSRAFERMTKNLRETLVSRDVLAMEVAERKQAEDALQASQEQLLEAQRTAHIGNWDWNLVTDDLYWSAENYRIFGLDPATVEPSFEAFMAAVAPADKESVEQAIQDAWDQRRPYDIDMGIIRADGTRRTVNARAQVIFDAAGKAVRMSGTVQDITERKNAEGQLRRFQLGIERSREAIFITALDGQITYVNPAFEELYGYSEAEALGKTPRILKSGLVPQEAYEDFWSDLLAKRPVVGEIVNKAKDGSIITVDNSANPILNGDGDIIGFLAIQRDVTDRKRMEEQLQQSQLLASMGEMTAGIAHEVNNPLSAILLYSELINQSALPPAVKKDLKVIRSEAKRASSIMKNLLTYSRKAEPITRRMDIHRTLRKVVDMRRYQQQVRNIDIAVNLADGPLRVHGNAAQLTQVFMNLIVNAEEAIENSDDKRIVVTTEVDLKQVRISIADSGIGIPEEHLTQVFVPFYSTKPTGKGTGLGLATCHGIVTAHGGLIRAENNDMGGATFIVELPLA